MVILTFVNGTPNESLEIGDLVYYISNPNTNFEGSGFITGDSVSGVSTYILLGTVSSIQIDNDPDQVGQTVLDEDTGEEVFIPDQATTENTFTVFVENIGEIIQPLANDFIFFAKNNNVNLSSVLGYYNSVILRNNSTTKAELFAISCDVVESSK